MRSIRKSYEKIAQRKKNQGAYISLCQAVKGRGFSRKNIVKAFKEIIPVEDYAPEEVMGLVGHLEQLAKRPVEVEI